MYLQIIAGSTTGFVFGGAVVLVFLVLAGQYESWSLPLAVILVVPMCILCSVAGVAIARMDINVFTQIGFVVLVGLASKNAILIVEFAKSKRESGLPRREATLAACKLRLRPILMTSFAFIFGVIPLVVSTGAGAEMRRTLGIAVFSGMLGVTLFGIFLTPVFYNVIQWFGDRRQEKTRRQRPRLPARKVAESHCPARARNRKCSVFSEADIAPCRHKSKVNRYGNVSYAPVANCARYARRSKETASGDTQSTEDYDCGAILDCAEGGSYADRWTSTGRSFTLGAMPTLVVGMSGGRGFHAHGKRGHGTRTTRTLVAPCHRDHLPRRNVRLHKLERLHSQRFQGRPELLPARRPGGRSLDRRRQSERRQRTGPRRRLVADVRRSGARRFRASRLPSEPFAADRRLANPRGPRPTRHRRRQSVPANAAGHGRLHAEPNQQDDPQHCPAPALRRMDDRHEPGLGTRLLGPVSPGHRIGRRETRFLGRELRRRAGPAVVRSRSELRERPHRRAAAGLCPTERRGPREESEPGHREVSGTGPRRSST